MVKEYAMSFTTNLITPELIQESLTYSKYRTLINERLADGQSTGEDHSEAMLNYTKMNVRRMNRWDKTAVLSSELQQKVTSVDTPQVWLVLTEAWCGDAAQNIPFLARLADQNPLIDIRFILRDEHLDVMDAYLTDGGRSIPKLIALKKEPLEELFTWGPRPQALQQKYLAYKEDGKGVSQEDFIESLHLWYAKDRNKNIDAEFVSLIQ